MEVPSCRKIIEQSIDPAMMWTDLYEALVKAYEQEPVDENVISQIYTFALMNWKNASGRRSEYLSEEVGRLFERVLLIEGAPQSDVGNRVPERELKRMRSTHTQLYASE